MNLSTVITNLKNTIAGKKNYLLALHQKRTVVGLRDDEVISLVVTSEFLKENIDELQRILQDVETCCEKATEQSWALNPDRSGGQYTQDEIYDMNRSGWIEP